VIHPDWQAPAAVRAFVTTRAFGDLSREEVRRKLRGLLPDEPGWLKQVHGNKVVEAGSSLMPEADAAVARKPGSVCVVQAADCTTVAAAHAGWRGLARGILEATVETMDVAPQKLIAWLGPAIGPRVYEVGEDVRSALAKYGNAFSPTRPGHWLLDLYAVARHKLHSKGLRHISGGGFCTYSEKERFFSYRRDRTNARMAAFIWLA
jgi:YfiH family protein